MIHEDLAASRLRGENLKT